MLMASPYMSYNISATIPFDVPDSSKFQTLLLWIYKIFNQVMLSSNLNISFLFKKFDWLIDWFCHTGQLVDLSSPTRDRTQATAVKEPSPNHWTARKFPSNLNISFLIMKSLRTWSKGNYNKIFPAICFFPSKS